MTGRKSDTTWWYEITRSERFSGAEWLLLGVSALALGGALVLLLRVVG